MLAVSDEQQSTTAWDIGALGEERLGKGLDRLASDTLRLLHDRRIPRSKANIDHLAVTTSGVYVIDAKKYRGRPHLKIEGGLFRPRLERLLVGSRDCTKLVDGVLKQVEFVRPARRRCPGPRCALFCRSRLATDRRHLHHPRRAGTVAKEALSQAPGRRTRHRRHRCRVTPEARTRATSGLSRFRLRQRQNSVSCSARALPWS
jgi:hypothetical protein